MTIRKGPSAVAAALAGAVLLGTAGPRADAAPPPAIAVRTNVDASGWSRLLARYVDDRGLVDYRAWKSSAPDRAVLESYVRDLAGAPSPEAGEPEREAVLINAYNALTISWILDNFPTESIRSLPDSFAAKRFTVGGRKVSLDDIEGALRESVGYRVHSAISCASRSCPPLSRDAFEAGRLEEQLDAQMRRWLARRDLNRFEPEERLVRVSQIFKWFEGDFRSAGGVRGVLVRFAPTQDREFLRSPGLRIEYFDYDWGLNDQGGLGKNYSKLNLLWDKLRGKS